MAITQPPILFDKPFADAGDKTIIPSAAGAAGKANLQEGFPPITQVPLGSGGIAPDRLDFNGILYMLSAYAHWMQSGGMFAWSDTLDYAVPSIVYQDGDFYACLAASGPGTTAGAQDPATATAYWGTIGADVVFDKLATARLISVDPTQTAGKLFDGSANIAIGVAPNLTDGLESSTLPPVGAATALTTLLNTIRNNLKWLITATTGTVIYVASNNAPLGYVKANGAAISRTAYAPLFNTIGTAYGPGDGSTTFNVPDLRGEFLRGFDDGRGVDSGRVFGSKQGDAIRNITGKTTFLTAANGAALAVYNAATGAFTTQYSTGTTLSAYATVSTTQYAGDIFNASKVVPTAAENRPRNVALLACVKY